MPNTLIPIGRSPLHHWHQAHGAHFVDQDGWQVVAAYSSAEPEAAAARVGLGLADVSACAKISLRGAGVSTLIPQSAAPGPRGVETIAGGLGLACRLTDDHVLLLASPTTVTALEPWLAGWIEGRAVVRADVTSAYAGFEIVGLQWEEFLRRLTHLDVRPAALPIGSCAETGLAGVEALLVRPAGRSLPALRIYVASDLGEYVWERLMETGSDVPITPVGLEALHSL